MSGVAISIDVDGDSPILTILKNLSDFEQRKSELFDDIGNIVVDGIRSRWAGGEGLEGKWPLSIRAMRKGDITLIDKAGELVAKVIPLLSGWKPESSTRPLTLVRISEDFSSTCVYITMVFESSLFI